MRPRPSVTFLRRVGSLLRPTRRRACDGARLARCELGQAPTPGDPMEESMQSPKKFAVAGATGRVGHHVVDVLRARGYDVVPMSRSQGVDVITGDGLAAALAGVGCVIDTATGPSPEQEPATTFFTTAARNLQDAGQE